MVYGGMRCGNKRCRLCSLVLVCLVTFLYVGIGRGWLGVQLGTRLRHLIPFYTHRLLYPQIYESVCTHKTIDSLALTEKSMSEVNLYYPSPSEHLWVKAHGSLVIRREAHYDDRDSPAIVLNALYNDYNKHQPVLHALLIYEGFKTGECILLKYWKANSWLAEAHQEYYVNRMLRIDLDTLKTKLPQYVSVTEDSNCNTCLSDLIPIKNNKGTKQYKFGVCLHKGLFGSIKPQKVIEWIEVHRILGAEVITIYLQDDLVEVYNAIEPYIKDGIVEVLEWRLREPVIRGYTRDYGQSGTINECAYRNLYKVKYLAMYDIDEFIIPQSGMITWQEMFTNIEKLVQLDKYASYVFYNTNFLDSDKHLPEAELLNSMCPKLSMPLFVKRTDRDAHPQDFRSPKLFYQLHAFETGQVHFVRVWRKGYEQQYYVPADIGLTHHYRSWTESDVKDREVLHDANVMSKYAKAVLQALEKRICA